MNNLTWQKDDYLLVANARGWEFVIDKTEPYPRSTVPRSQKWTLTAIGPWYMSVCQPTQKACQQAAERVLDAAGILNPKEAK